MSNKITTASMEKISEIGLNLNVQLIDFEDNIDLNTLTIIKMKFKNSPLNHLTILNQHQLNLKTNGFGRFDIELVTTEDSKILNSYSFKNCWVNQFIVQATDDFEEFIIADIGFDSITKHLFSHNLISGKSALDEIPKEINSGLITQNLQYGTPFYTKPEDMLDKDILENLNKQWGDLDILRINSKFVEMDKRRGLYYNKNDDELNTPMNSEINNETDNTYKSLFE